MTENNSPNAEENQEPTTEPANPPPQSEGNPSEEKNQEPATEPANPTPPHHPQSEGNPSEEKNQDTAGLEDTSETIPPTEHEANTWLDQFEAFKDSAMTELLAVAGQGLTEIESEVLIVLASKLVLAAEKHEPEAVDKLLHLISASH